MVKFLLETFGLMKKKRKLSFQIFNKKKKVVKSNAKLNFYRKQIKSSILVTLFYIKKSI